MRVICFLTIFLVSCSIRDKLIPSSTYPTIDNKSLSLKYDSNNDGEVSQQEFKNFKEQKKVFNPYVDYYNPFIIFFFILLLILSCCSLSYISSVINSFYIWFLSKIKRN